MGFKQVPAKSQAAYATAQTVVRHELTTVGPRLGLRLPDGPLVSQMI
jgi:hypothetical protein